MKELFPTYILERFEEGSTHGYFEGVAIFVDLSGFTPLTDLLLQRGNEGADILSKVINHIFEPLVHLVYQNGGFIPYFAGDAFTGLFPLSRGIMADNDAYLRLSSAMITTYNPLIPPHFGLKAHSTVDIKVGVARGLVEWGIVGHGKKSFYFRGMPIEASAHAQTLAQKGEVVVHHSVLDGSSLSSYESPVDAGFHRFRHSAFERGAHQNPGVARIKHLPKQSILKQFLPAALLENGPNLIGEFRMVVSVFIGFGELEVHREFDEFANTVLVLANLYSGYFKEIDFGDKGGVMVVLFGLPVSYENNTYRALEFALELKKAVEQFDTREQLKLHMGITSGKAFAGLIGGKERKQYAAAGNCVNLAARLMVQAEPGEILVDKELVREKQFVFQPKGSFFYKGFSDKIQTFQLLGHRLETLAFKNKLIGRSAEIKRLTDFAKPLQEGNYAGLAIVFGEAGVGKSHLCYELKHHLDQLSGQPPQWVICQADQILKKPFNPFIYFLKRFFNQSTENSQEVNSKNFEMHFVFFRNKYEAAPQVADESVAEYIRTKTVLAGLLGIHIKDSLWDKLDARGRYRNTIAAISNLLFLEARVSPLVLELEDGHWYDPDSVVLLKELLKKASHYPILFLLTSRYNEEGKKQWLIEPSVLESFQVPRLDIDLNMFSRKALSIFAEEKLGGSADPSFIDLLQRTTNGNPFYLDQVLEYFVESESLVQVEGKWNLRDKNLKFSNSINAILTARIDRLSLIVKETVKAAAVIGREFEVPVLNEVMQQQAFYKKENGNTDLLLKNQINQAERVQIWQAINELRYIFKHSLLREAIYGMQLHTRLKELHQLIAEAIEKLYRDNLEERYVDLAFHYEQAENKDKTILYLEKSADYARRNFQNNSAIGYYKKLTSLLDKENPQLQASVLLRLGSVQELIGEWKECIKNYYQALELAKASKNPALVGHAHNSLGYFLMLRGDYQEAGEQLKVAAALYQEAGEPTGNVRVLGNLGNLFFRQGTYEEAKAYFEKSIDLAIRNGKPELVSQTAANLGLTFMNLGFYEQGIRSMLKQLAYCQDAGDKQGMASIYTNLGIVYFEKGDFDEALSCFEQGLNRARELGDKLLMAIAIGSMGSVFQKRGDYEKAESLFRNDLKVCQELGDKQGIAIAFGLLGELYSLKGDFEKADRFLSKNLELSRELGYQKGIAKALDNLGDVAFFTGKNEGAIDYYDEAISVARKIDNKLVLGFSLLEKINPLIKLKRWEEARSISQEARNIALKIRNHDMLFGARLAFARAHGNVSEEAERQLNKLLKDADSDEKKAQLYYYLFCNAPDKNAYRIQALTWYSKLVRLFPSYKNRSRLQELNK